MTVSDQQDEIDLKQLLGSLWTQRLILSMMLVPIFILLFLLLNGRDYFRDTCEIRLSPIPSNPRFNDNYPAHLAGNPAVLPGLMKLKAEIATSDLGGSELVVTGTRWNMKPLQLGSAFNPLKANVLLEYLRSSFALFLSANETDIHKLERTLVELEIMTGETGYIYTLSGKALSEKNEDDLGELFRSVAAIPIGNRAQFLMNYISLVRERLLKKKDVQETALSYQKTLNDGKLDSMADPELLMKQIQGFSGPLVSEIRGYVSRQAVTIHSSRVLNNKRLMLNTALAAGMAGFIVFAVFLIMDFMKGAKSRTTKEV